MKQTKTLQLEGIKIFKHNAGTIALTNANGFIGQVSDDPKSKNHNEQLFKNFKQLLEDAGKWN